MYCLRDVGHGAVFKCCIFKDSINLVGYFFVDNSIIIQTFPYLTTPTNETIKISKSGLDLFASASRATVGKVSGNKTKCYLLKFKWYASVMWKLVENEEDMLLSTPEVP